MADTFTEKGRLPACSIDEPTFERVWEIFSVDGDFLWQAVVGTGDDVLGQHDERPQEIVTDRSRLFELLAGSPRIDSLQFTVEVTGQGAASFTFRNYDPPAGALVVAGEDETWTVERFDALADLFASRRDAQADKLYSKLVFTLIHSVLPLFIASVIAVAVGLLLIPASIRQSEFLWWTVAGTIFATMWLGNKLSDKFIAHCLQNRPYLRWHTKP